MIVRTPDELRVLCNKMRDAKKRVAFVPTMGALHEGHLALVRAAKARADFVVVSIFVNPTQFGPNEDFARYPRDLEGDVKKVEPAGADAVFAPERSAMYALGEETRVHVGALAEPLDGAFRPGHFEGVTTVVAKLFALVGESVAVFGRKDYQQLAIIRRMTADLFLPVTIVGHPIVREKDGLAMSSRNAYLSADERARALSLSRGLRAASDAFARGERDARALERITRAEVEHAMGAIDYVSVVDADSLAAIEKIDARALVAIACRIGKTRLIDNFVVGDDDPSSLIARGADAM
jgi:pantoate--beta-alanine ligase